MSALICRETGRRYPADSPIWRSEAGGLLDLEFAPRIDPDMIRRGPPTLWRYRDAIPIERDENIVTLGEGCTPLVACQRFGPRVLLKYDALFPSGSYKDRGASVLISKARELGIGHVVADSSGNAGAAIAAYGAAAGIACDIYVPASNSPGKLLQIEMCGARLHRVPGTRQDAADACWNAAQRVYYASHAWDPFFFHGVKTFAYEVVEQLGWRAPDAMLLPTGNGTLLIGAYIGLCELRDAGLIDHMPKLIGVQSEGCAPLARAWTAGRDQIEDGPVQATIAEGISIARPVRAAQCFEAVRETGGTFLTVRDEEILAALRTAIEGGFYIEPTSAAALAALEHYEALDETIIVPLTGHGLKATEKLTHLWGFSS